MSGGTRKDNGDSWISEKPNKDGFYEAKVWMGLKGDGKPDRRNVRRRDPKALKKRVKELENLRDAGKAPRAGKPPTVRAMLDRHVNVTLPAGDASPKTIESYRSLCKTQIYPRWGAQRADRLLPEHVEDGLAAMMRAGLAPSSARKVYAVLSSAYERQVERGNLVRNPCQFVRPPKLPESEMPLLSDTESRRVLEAAAGRPTYARWVVGLGCGIRQGEALGLRWEYLDLERGEMRVWWQLQRLTWSHGCAGAIEDDAERARIEHDCAGPHCKKKPCPKKCSRHTRKCPPPCPLGCAAHASLCPGRIGGGLVLRPIKEKRRKSIPLAAEFTELLLRHREAQQLQRDLIGHLWEDRDFVFCQWNGKPVDPRRDWGEWGQIMAAAQLPRHRVHAMRHSAASIALAEGVALAVVQEMLGHSDIRMTRRYSHVNEALARDASSRMASALGLTRKEEPEA